MPSDCLRIDQPFWLDMLKEPNMDLKLRMRDAFSSFYSESKEMTSRIKSFIKINFEGLASNPLKS